MLKTMPEKVHEPHQSRFTGPAIEKAVFGFMDGLVTDLAVVAGVVAAPSSTMYFVVVAALAATLASSLSMFLGAYVAAESRYKFTMREMALELKEVKEIPEVERQEVRDIYQRQGFTPEETEIFLARVTSDKDLWVRTMMREELGFGEEEMTPPRVSNVAIIGITTFFGALVPLLPFVVVTVYPSFPTIHGLSLSGSALVASLILSTGVLAAVGAYKERFGEDKPLKGAFQMVLVGLGGAALVYILVNVLGMLLTR